MVRVTKLLALYDKLKHEHPMEKFHAYKAFFMCGLEGGEAKESLETKGVSFFGEDELPPLSLARVTVAQVHRMFEHFRYPDLPTDFD